MSATGSRPLNNRNWRRIAAWIVLVCVATALLIAARHTLDKSHIALTYLMLVLVGTSQLGRRGGVTLALVCFFAFNFFLLPPYHTFLVADDRDWLVLLAFLLTSLVAAQLVYRAQDEAATARSRSLEIDRLSTLGAETLSAGRAEEAVTAIARVVQSTLKLSRCEIFLAGGHPVTFQLIGQAAADEDAAAATSATDRMFDYVVEHSAVAVERIDGTIHVLTNNRSDDAAPWIQSDARVVVLPLRVRDRCVGIMRLSDDARVHLDMEQRRFAQALAYYAALGIERVRLMAVAERTEALRAADQLKDSFVAAVSHDLRTPLTTIKGLAHELRALDERAAVIEAEADRLNHFVSDVLDLSKLNSGAVHVQPELNAAEDLAGAALAQINGLPGAKHVIVQQPEGDVIVGWFDFVHSLRCLVNLLENALKYSPEGSPVELAIGRDDNHVTFAVRDRGPGVDSAHVPRIFEPFVRLAGTPASGAGLGLAIARRLANAQGGTISYEQRGGGGSVFTLAVPASAERHQPMS